MRIQSYLNKYSKSDFFRGFAATLFGSGLSKVILALATFLFAHELSKGDFGEFSFIRNTLNTVLCVCALNFTSICTKFTVEAKTRTDSLCRLLYVFIFSFTICVFTGLLLYVLPIKILINLFTSESLVSVFRIIGIFLPLYIFQPLIEGVLRGLMRFKLIGILQNISAILFVCVVYAGIKINGLDGAVIGILIYYCFYAILSILVVIILRPFPNIRSALPHFRNEIGVIKTIILPIFLMSFIEAPVLWLAQVILAKAESMSSVGSMTAIFQIRNIIILIPSYLFSTFLAFAGELNSNRQYDVYFGRFQRMAKMLIYAGCISFVLCSVFSRQILGLYGRSYMDDYIPMIVSNIEIPFLLIIGLLKIDLVIQEHQDQLLYSSLSWNFVWLLLLVVFIYLGVQPLVAFFFSQLIGIIFYTIWLIVIYKKDKSRLCFHE